jgi:transcriptional regulator with XRE-family HTH domain
MAKHLGEVIRDLRKRAGVSQVALARAAGIDPAIVSRIEAGSREGMHFGNLCRVARALDVSLDDIAAAAGLLPSTQRSASKSSGRLRFNEGVRQVQTLLGRAADQLESLKSTPEGRAHRRPR